MVGVQDDIEAFQHLFHLLLVGVPLHSPCHRSSSPLLLVFEDEILFLRRFLLVFSDFQWRERSEILGFGPFAFELLGRTVGGTAAVLFFGVRGYLGFHINENFIFFFHLLV